MAAANRLRTALGRDEAAWQPEELVGAFDVLAGRDELAASLLALALVATAGPRAGWSEPWRARLRHLRANPDADVATAALGITTASE